MMTTTGRIRHPSVWLAAAALCALVVGACGGDDTAGTSSGSGGAATGSGGSGGATGLPEPEVHRPAAETCVGEPPAGNPLPEPGGECETDADCTDGTNGRCIWPYGGGNVCRYDECFEDSDCGGASICACRVPESFSFNRCFLGNCVVDADCGSAGWCSPSAVHVGPTCMTGISPGSVGYFCHTAEDECIDDSDCGAQDVAACLFDVDAMHWVCQELLCTG
jgi:hypothetical protein